MASSAQQITHAQQRQEQQSNTFTKVLCIVTFHTKYPRALNFEHSCHSYLIRLGFDYLKHDLQAAEAHEMSEALVAQLLPRPLALEPEVTAANWQRLRSRRSSDASCLLPESRDSIPGTQETVHDRERDAAARALQTHMRGLLLSSAPPTALSALESCVSPRASCPSWPSTVLPSPVGRVTGGEERGKAAERRVRDVGDPVPPLDVACLLPDSASPDLAVNRQHNSAEKLVNVKEEQEESSDRVREATSAQMPRPGTSLAHIHTYMTVERVKFVAVDEIQGQSNSEVALQQAWGGKQQA